MKTKTYNPSTLELEFAQAIQELSGELQKKIKSNKILNIENKNTEDNPVLIFSLLDNDGDKHEIVLKIIQRIDQ
jgi:hypothetical protein